MEQPAHHAGAARVGEEFAVIADQAARRREERQPQLAAARWPHVLHLGLAPAHLLDDDAGEFLVDVDDDLLDRLEPLAGRRIGAEQHARARDRHLEAFAAHRLDQHAELQFAAAGDLDRVLLAALAHLDRDIALGLAIEALGDHARGDLVAVAPGERRIVDREGHRQGRRIDRVGRQRPR